MGQVYSDKAKRTLDAETREDLQKIVGKLKESAGDYRALVSDLVDGGGYASSFSEKDILNRKFLSINYLNIEKSEVKEYEDRIDRIADYYRYLKTYESVKKRRESKIDSSKANSKTEAASLKQVEKIKKESDLKIIKTIADATWDFGNRVDDRYTKAVFDFQTRWSNNNEKVGNIFSQNYQNLQQDFNRFLNQAGGPFLQKARYYRSFATKYGLEEIAESTLDCLIKRTPVGEVVELINEIQKELDQFKKDADTVITESLKIADNLVGIAEEVRDNYKTTKKRTQKIKNQYKDYRKKLKAKKIPTKKDSKKSKMMRQFVNVILPMITTKIANIISTIIDNACNEDEIAVVAIPNIIDKESFRNSLQNVYGYSADTGDDYLSMLQDVSGFLTPVEICRLFNGEAPDEVLSSVYYFISLYYKKIFVQLSTKPKLAGFFVFIGQLVDPSFCKEIEFSSLGDDFCFEPDSYQAQMRECLIEESPELLGRLRENYVELRKRQLRDVLEFSFYPFEMRGEAQKINEIFNNIDRDRKERPLLRLAGEYESQYNQSLLNMPRTFIKEQQRTEVQDVFSENIFAGALDDLPKETRDAFNNQIPGKVTRLERHILPSFHRSMFLRDDETRFNSSNKEEFSFSKSYYLSPNAGRRLSSTIQSLFDMQKLQSQGMGADQMRLNLDYIYYNPAFQVSSYYDENMLKFSTKEGEYECNQSLTTHSSYIYPGNRTLEAEKVLLGLGNFPEISPNTEFNVRENNHSFVQKSSRNKDALVSYKTYLDKAGFAGTTDKNALYNIGFKDTYNKLVNVCANSVFAKKIPIGLAGPSDNGNVSGLEVVKIGQDLDPECSANLVDNFGMISFKKDAKQAARADISEFVRVSLEDEEDDIREKYFHNVMSFKTHILDFITKSIFLFSEFNFEKDEVDDSMIDYIYVEYFKSLVEKDINLNQDNLEFKSLTDSEKKNFINNLRANQDVSGLLKKYKSELQKIPSELAAQKKELNQSDTAFEAAKNTIEKLFIARVLDNNIDQFISRLDRKAFGYSINPLIGLIKSSKAYSWTGYVFSAKETYDRFIKRLENFRRDAQQIALNVGYLIFDMETGKLKDLSIDSIAAQIKDELGGFIDDQVDELLIKAKAWNNEWVDWHDKNVGSDPDNVYTDSKTYKLQTQDIDYKLNLWTGGSVVSGDGIGVPYTFEQIYIDLEKEITPELKIYAKELKDSTFASQQIIGLNNKSILLQSLIDQLVEFERQQKNIKYNLSYDVSRTLLHYHNENYPSKKTDEFCVAVRNLICHEVSNNSKTLKEIIYTPQMRGERIFDIKDRMIEKQLNIFHSNKPSFKSDGPDQLYNVLNNTIGGDFPYFNTSFEDDEYIEKYLPSVVMSQIGQTHFHMTKVKFDPTKDVSASVDVYMVRASEGNQLARAGFPMKNLGDIGKQKDEDYFDIQEKEYIKKAFVKYKISEKDAGDALSGEVDIAEEVAKLFEAMDGIGTYEGIIFNVLEKNKPADVVRIQKMFDIVYINVEGYGTLVESLKDEMSGSELQRALNALDRANREVEKAGGIVAGAFNFVPYPDFNNLIDDPFKTKKTFKEKVAEAFGFAETPIRNDSLYAGGYRWITNAKYPASVLSQFFGRTKWKIGDYKHREDNKSKIAFGFIDVAKRSSRAFTEKDYDGNPRIKNYLKGVARQIVPNYTSVIDNFRRARVYYKKTPVMSFKVDASNYKVFVENYTKANGGRKPTIQEYVNHCLKHAIVKRARSLVFENDNFGNIYSNSFPLQKMLSHIAINMNKYVTYINNIDMEGPDLLPVTVSAVKGVDNFAFFNQKNLLSLGLGAVTTGLSLADMDKIKVANQNLSVNDILMLTESADFTVYFIKTVIKYFLRNTERADLNIQISKGMADSTSKTIRFIYTVSRLIVNSGQTIAKVFGADDPGDGIPSAAELDTQFKGMRYLFNLPTTPFAIANWIAGTTPSNLQAWITYVSLEATLITIELLEDYGVIDELVELLFGGEINNPLAAPGFNYATACKLAAEQQLKDNPIIEKYQKTLGGEYLLPDGREYVGEYHIHKDGTIMVGGDHPKDQPKIVLEEKFTRDDIDV